MSNVVQFPARKAVSGPIYCDIHDVSFPQVLRIVQTLTAGNIAKSLAEAAIVLGDLEPIRPGEYVYYDLDTCHYGDITSWDRVTFIDAADMSESIFIRFHESEAEALAYLSATMDLHFDPDSAQADWGPDIYRTENGVFTLARRETRVGWPGPLIVYLARRKEPVGIQCQWAIAVGPGGQLLDPVELEII